MTVVAVTGGAGAPGATSTALALLLTWPLPAGRRVILIEADPDGGSILAGALQGRVSAEYGLHQLGVAHRQGNLVDAFFRQLVDLSDGRRERLLLPGLVDPTQASGLAYTWDPISQLAAGLGSQQIPHDVIIDLGRRGTTGASAIAARRADLVLPVVRGTLPSLAQAHPRLVALRNDLDTHGTGSDSIALVVIEQGRYARQEIGKHLETPVLGLLPFDPERARVLSDGEGDTGKRFLRSRFMRAARSTAEAALALAEQRRMRLAPRPTGGGELPSGPEAPMPSDGWAQAAAYIRRPADSEVRPEAEPAHRPAGEEAGHVR
ncbi:hypothetical protein OG948_27890 [Embleya sp. NBC_00888]|uniref:hypothetical protein n=1 Tax=Embleya sp. NBC_00888 TaxID=2975960 RepID=UPI00386424CB|nr:hypothetical protein OG948_27890 [Embleya sp. NBC_00888]